MQIFSNSTKSNRFQFCGGYGFKGSWGQIHTMNDMWIYKIHKRNSIERQDTRECN